MGATFPIEKIILFDGVCNLCSASVRFVIKRDKKNTFRFASLQSEFARNIISSKNIDDSGKTIVLLKSGKIYLRSEAALEICRDLNGLWPGLYVLKIIPRYFRDRVYNSISNRRYRWF